MENPVTITLDRAQVAEWRVAKAMASRDTGQSLTWGDFFDMLVGSYEQSSEPRIAYMGQELPKGEDEAEFAVLPDDAMTLAAAAMTGSAAALSEETCELIAEKVAEKIVERLKSLNLGLTED